MHAAVLVACGTLNGGVGDYINDPRACNFDARTLICPGADSPSCLTPAQANVANLLYQGSVDKSGHHLATGGMAKGSELQWVNYNVRPAGVSMSTAPARFSAWDYPLWLSSFDVPTDVTADSLKPNKIVSSYLKSPSDPTVVKTRPNFPYPNVARYRGTGDINSASSYVESAPDVTVNDNYIWLGSHHFRSNYELWCAQRPTADGLGTSFMCGPKGEPDWHGVWAVAGDPGKRPTASPLEAVRSIAGLNAA